MDNNNDEVQEQVAVETPGQPAGEQQPKQPAKKKLNKKFLIGSIVVVVVLLGGIAYVGQQIYERGQESNSADIPGEVAGAEVMGPVAVVNGNEITRERFDFRYNLEAKGAATRGLDLNDTNTQDFFARQVLDNVVTVELLLQQAQRVGISTTDEAINTQYQTVVDTLGGEELFTQQLAQDNLTAEGLRNDIREQLIIENFVNYYSEQAGVQVSDEEIQAAYDNAALTNDTLPPLETISEQIGSQLLQQRNVEAVNQLLESIKGDSDIQLNINWQIIN